MDSFTDYYAVLGVDSHASASTIKAAFKKLALKYHPDVYKGPDAEERMRNLLLAYQALSDPESRRNYDAQRAEYFLDSTGIGQDVWRGARHAGEPLSNSVGAAMPSQTRRRENQRTFVFPDLSKPLSAPITLRLGDVTYQLWPDDARILKSQGMLRGVATESTGGLPQSSALHPVNYCHRCHHRWVPAAGQSRSSSGNHGIICPACKASDWAEYLLLSCVHCQAVFESEEIRDKVIGGGRLYNPYELFPLCPNCRRSQWCPAENARIDTLRLVASRRRAILWMSVLVVAILLIGVMAAVVLR